MLSPIVGRLRRPAAETIARAVLPALSLLWPTLATARALDRPDPEAGSYSIEAFSVLQDDARLPQDLRVPSAWTQALPHAGAKGPVELHWTAYEQAGFRGYRLTALIEGGPLSGAAMQWHVAPGSGRRRWSGAYEYLVRLNLPAFFDAHLRAALEGLRADGSRVLLAVRDVRARPRPQPLDAGWSRSREADGHLHPSATTQRCWLTPSHAATIAPLPSGLSSEQPNAARVRAGGGRATRVRGPPSAI